MPDEKVTEHKMSIQTSISEVPDTIKRPVFNPTSNELERLPNPGTPRANVAASVDEPDGTPEWADKHRKQTVLQQHCAFFDRDNDGVVWPHDTFLGLYALGFDVLSSFAGACFAHLLFSYPTCSGALPDPLFRIWLANIHNCKHGSDSGVFDSQGRFVPQKFEDFFAMYSKGKKEGLALEDLWDAVRGQRCLLDPVGSLCTAAWWTLTFFLLRPEGGFVKKEDVRKVFDGSIFESIARERVDAGSPEEAGKSTEAGTSQEAGKKNRAKD